ncbi:MAG: alpha/beta hydrolase [Pseudomonadota bacterium]
MAEPLVLVPGMMCDARVWATQATIMGYERTVIMAPVCKGDRIEEMASGLLTTLPPKFALCGHGMGGVIALEIARRAPERVIRLALIGTNPLSDTPQEAADREPRMIAAKAGRFDRLLETDLLPRSVGQGPHRDEAMQALHEMALSLGPDLYARQERAMQRRRDQQSTLRRITQPTLVIAGRDDGIVPLKRQEFLSELIPYAEISVIDQAGHLPMLEAPEETIQALFDWMRQPLVLR